MVDQRVLGRVTWLASLNAAAKRELAARSIVRSFRGGVVLWRAKSEPRGLFIVLEGEVRVVQSVAGRQRVVHTEGPGGTLGEVPLFGDGTYPATAIAARATSCLVLTREGILAAMRQDSKLALIFLARLGNRVRALITRLDDVSSRSVPARLASYLLARRDAAGGGGSTFTLGRSQHEVAEDLGTVREVVVRALRALRTAGFIRSPARGRFQITTEAALRQLAGRAAD